MKDLRIGVIGAGGRGGLAGHAHKPGEGSRITACCDIRDEVLARMPKRYGEEVFVTKSVDELLAQDLDAVFVCSPDFLHEEHAVAALKAGKAVYLEKPIAITVEGCDRILATAQKTGSKLYVGHNMRHFQSVLKMKEIIDSGEIGEIQAVWCRHFIAYGGDAYFKDWHSERKYTTGLLLQKGAHDIDVIHWLAGGYTTRVTAMGKLSVYDKCERRSSEERGDATFRVENWPPLSQKKLSPNIDVEDHSMILMQLDNGVQASYSQCHYTPDNIRNYTFIGTEGRIENYGDSGACRIAVFNARHAGNARPADIIHDLDPQEGGHGGSDPAIVEEFLDYVRGIREPTTSPVAARMSVAAGCMATKSLREGGQPYDVPPLPDSIA